MTRESTSALMCVCIMNIDSHWFLRYAPETRLLESNLFWLRDEGQNVGQRS